MRGWLALVLLAACAHATDQRAPPRRRLVTENVLRRDYAGSEECADCHRAIYDKWRASPMRNMTRLVDGATVRAPFDGGTFTFKGETITFSTENGARVMRVFGRPYRITKVIGGRTREDFVGVADTGEEQVLPASFVYATHSWRYKGYSVMVPERPTLSVGPVWQKTCIFCHNTAPYLTQVYDDLLGPGTRGYQGSVSDAFLPRDRLWRVVVTDERALAAAVGEEIALLGPRPDPATPTRTLLAEAMRATRRRFGESHLVEVGIGCEACHLGARQHADDPEVKPTFEPRGDFLRLATPDGRAPTRAQLINHTCVRCHTVLFSGYDHTWEGGRRDAGAGGSSINSGEARDFLLGGCQSQLSCVACHDPHGEDPRPKLAAMATPAGNGACTSCHPRQADDGHSHHAGVGCIACHMPRKNVGLGYELTRYHRIGSPTDPARVLGDRPLECALCHGDKSVASLVGTMETWWGKRYDRAALRRLYGDDLEAGALAVTLERGLPHEQAAAVGALGEGRIAVATPLLLPHLTHPYPLVRQLVRKALVDITGREMEIDLDAPADQIRARAARWQGARP